MNYSRHYEKLINRARTRSLNGYFELHHVMPRCMGGNDDSSNLVQLTPEEHYVAHQLLIKIYPHNYKLVNATVMMCVTGASNQRTTNKLFGWLRRRLSTANSVAQSGPGNSQFGTKWVYNLKQQISKKVSKSVIDEYIVEGWQMGRVMDFSTIHNCVVCNKPIKGESKTCGNFCFRQLQRNQQAKRNPFIGRETELLNLYHKHKNLNKVLKIMGFPGNQSHWGRHARNLLKPN